MIKVLNFINEKYYIMLLNVYKYFHILNIILIIYT